MYMSSVRASDNPYLCLAYKLPMNQQMALAVNVRGVGWRSISFSSSPSTRNTILASFWDYSVEDAAMNDDRLVLSLCSSWSH